MHSAEKRDAPGPCSRLDDSSRLRKRLPPFCLAFRAQTRVFRVWLVRSDKSRIETTAHRLHFCCMEPSAERTVLAHPCRESFLEALS
jgi:hypothetical protein